MSQVPSGWCMTDCHEACPRIPPLLHQDCICTCHIGQTTPAPVFEMPAPLKRVA